MWDWIKNIKSCSFGNSVTDPVFRHALACRAQRNLMFHLELLTSPWHYYEYKHYQELYTTGDWDGKHLKYRASRPSSAWIKATDWSAWAYEWAWGHPIPYVDDGRLLVFCCDWSNAFSDDPADHENPLRSRKRHCQTLAFAASMGSHPRLGAGSHLNALDDLTLKMILLRVMRY